MNAPYRTASSDRPRLWVPGTLLVEPLNGRVARLRPFGEWDAHADVTQWRKLETYVAREDLLSDGLEVLAPWPRLAALCARAPIRLVTGGEVSALRDRDARLFLVGFARNADDFLTVSAERGYVVERSVSGSFHELRRSLLPDDTRDPAAALEQLDHHRLADRILAAVTDGRVDGYTLALAELVDVVLGARVASYRWLRRLREDLERELEEIETRARATRDGAEEIVRRLRDCEGDRCDIPVYGVARRARHPELRVRCIGEGDLAARVTLRDSGDTLTLPAVDEWLVEGVAPWEPPSRAVRLSRERAVARAVLRRERLFRIAVLAGLVAALLFVIALASRAR